MQCRDPLLTGIDQLQFPLAAGPHPPERVQRRITLRVMRVPPREVPVGAGHREQVTVRVGEDLVALRAAEQVGNLGRAQRVVLGLILHGVPLSTRHGRLLLFSVCRTRVLLLWRVGVQARVLSPGWADFFAWEGNNPITARSTTAGQETGWSQ